ncbi:hypothetical protein BVRB_3g048250 [Beta vulgaris subsp. vulgaris]|nr:hypothetical protein BVRB_3g048250 [Beta vulgaris subsp. vulgaris]
MSPSPLAQEAKRQGSPLSRCAQNCRRSVVVAILPFAGVLHFFLSSCRHDYEPTRHDSHETPPPAARQ